jgi:hypothetical protein
MIGIAMTTSSGTGAVILEETEEIGRYENSARISRVSTLDGSVVVVHSGVTDGDRNINLKSKVTSAQESVLKTIFENETLVVISTKNGCYTGCIQQLTMTSGNADVKIILKEKISQ